MALFLQFSALTPKSKVLVFDNTHGLLLGAIRQRTGPDAEIYCCSQRNNKQDFKEFRLAFELGLTNDDLKNVNFVTMKDLEEMKEPKFT